MLNSELRPAARLILVGAIEGSCGDSVLVPNFEASHSIHRSPDPRVDLRYIVRAYSCSPKI